jgi:hypothetical protein
LYGTKRNIRAEENDAVRSFIICELTLHTNIIRVMKSRRMRRAGSLGNTLG